MTTSEDESTTYHSDLLPISRHSVDTFPMSRGKAVDVGIPGSSEGKGEGGSHPWGGAGMDSPSVRSNRSHRNFSRRPRPFSRRSIF